MLSVLIVDDEAPIRDWVEYCLKREPEKIQILGVAKSGQEACSLVKNQIPEVIITDIRMPGMSGLELMKYMRERAPYTEFIILTNYAEFSYAKEAISWGAREYLLKSEMKADDLIRILNKIEEEKLRIRHSKKQQRLPNGFVDLYGLYQTDQDSRRREFLTDIGVRTEEACQVLCFGQSQPEKQREFFTSLAAAEGVSRCIPASRNEYLLLILQDAHPRKLKGAGRRMAEKILDSRNTVVGISHCFSDTEDFITGLKQAITAYEYHFLSENQRIFDYDSLAHLPQLNFEMVRSKYQEIQTALSYNQYDQALVYLEQWFSMLKDISAQDVEWAVERCRRLVLMVEEQCFHLDPSEEREAKIGFLPKNLRECKNYCEQLIQKLYDKKNGKYSQSIEQALNYIHNNYNKDISLVHVAGIIFRSPEYFSRLFKEEVGENFSTYLIRYRLNRAREMLKKTDMKISEISYQVGYSTQSYFSRLYKKYMGKTPEEERSKS